MTSSLTQVVPSTSLASLAVSTASRDVKQPAVLGNRRTPVRLRTARTLSSAVSETRRIATVTNADPDARTALSRVVRLVAPPVPSNSREDRSSPAMTNGSGTELTTGTTELISRTVISATLKGGDDLDPRIGKDPRARPYRARDDVAVHRERDPPLWQ